MCDFFYNLKNVTIDSGIDQNNNCHLFDPLVKNCPFSIENSL